MTTKDQRSEVLELSQKITLPWTWGTDYPNFPAYVKFSRFDEWYVGNDKTAAYIVIAANIAPELVKEVNDLESELVKLRAELDQMKKEFDYSVIYDQKTHLWIRCENEDKNENEGKEV